MFSTFSQRECDVLRALEANGDLPLVQIARHLRLKVHSVQYAIQKFKDRGLLKRRVMVNTYQLGYTRYSMFITLGTQQASFRESFLRELCRHPQVSLLLEIGGEFQFELNITARSQEELQSFLSWFSERFGVKVFSKSIAVQMSHEVFGTRLLSTKKVEQAPLFHGAKGKSEVIDEVDHNIIRGLMREEFDSYRSLAGKIGLHPATMDKRLKALRARNIITGTTFLFDDPGLHHYVLLLFSRGLNPSLGAALRRHAKMNREFFYMVENLGAWDYELGIELADSAMVSFVLQGLYEKFESDLIQVKALPLFTRHKVMDYPFENLAKL